MNPESPLDPRQALEASLTAMLLGELPEDQAAFLRQAIASDAELAKLHARLQHTIGLVRETAATSATEPAKQPEPLRLSEERRQQLLQSFKTIAPKEFVSAPKPRVRWLVPAAVAAGVLLVVGGLLLPTLSRSKHAFAYNARTVGLASKTFSLEHQPTPLAESAVPENLERPKSAPPPVAAQAQRLGTLADATPSKGATVAAANSFQQSVPAATSVPAPPGTPAREPRLAASASSEEDSLALKGVADALSAPEHDKSLKSSRESAAVRGNSIAQRPQAPTEPGAPRAALASAGPAIVLPQSGEDGRDLAWFKESGDHGTAAGNEGLDLEMSGDLPGVILYESSRGRREPSQAGKQMVPPHPILTDGESVKPLGEESELPHNGNLSGPALMGGAVSGSVAFKDMPAGSQASARVTAVPDDRPTASGPGARPSDNVTLRLLAGKPADRSQDLKELAQQLAPPAAPLSPRAVNENRFNEVNGDVAIARERAAETAAAHGADTRTKAGSGALDIGGGSNAYAAANQNETRASGFDSTMGNWRFSNGEVGIIGGTAPAFTGTPSAANPASGITPYITSGGTLISGGYGAVSPADGLDGKNNKTPILGDLAYLGHAFRSDQSSQAQGEKFAISPSTSSSSGLGALNEGWMDSTRPRQFADTDEKKLAEAGGPDASRPFVFGVGSVRPFSGGSLASAIGTLSSAGREESNRKWDSPADAPGTGGFGAGSFGRAIVETGGGGGGGGAAAFGDNTFVTDGGASLTGAGGVGRNAGRSGGGALDLNYQWSQQNGHEDRVYTPNVVGYVDGIPNQNEDGAPKTVINGLGLSSLSTTVSPSNNNTFGVPLGSFQPASPMTAPTDSASGDTAAWLGGGAGRGGRGAGSGPAGARGGPAPSASTQSGAAVANNEIQKQLPARLAADFSALLNADPADEQKTLQDLFNSSTVRMNASPLLANNNPITARITESQSAPTATATPGTGISYYSGLTVDDVSGTRYLLRATNGTVTADLKLSPPSDTNGVLTWRQPIALPDNASGISRAYSNSSSIGDVYFSIDPETRRISGLEAKAAVDGVAVADSPSALLTPDTLRKFEFARAEPQSGGTGSRGVILPGANKDDPLGGVADQDTLKRLPTNAEKLDASTQVQNARVLFEAGKTKEARQILEQTVKEDPQNQAAYYYLNLMSEADFKGALAQRDVASRSRLTTLEEAWSIPRKRESLPQPDSYARTNLVETSPRQQAIQSKLRSIKLDNLKLERMPLAEVIKLLEQESKRRDPEQKGLNLLVDNQLWADQSGNAAVSDRATGLPVAAPGPGARPIDMNNVLVTIDPPISGVSLEDVLNIIARVADKPIDYSITDWGVVLSARGPGAQPAPGATNPPSGSTVQRTPDLEISTPFSPDQIVPSEQVVTTLIHLSRGKAAQMIGAMREALPGSATVSANPSANTLTVVATKNDLKRAIALINTMDNPVSSPLPVPPPEVQTKDNAFSTFSLNVSDVSFKLAAASLEKGQMPDPAGIRSEEFINAFDYRDPEPAAGAPIAFAWERARYPFAQNRDLVRFSLKTAALGRQPGRPLNLVLLLDNSGSMERADRVRIIHEALRVLAAQLGPQDTLSVVLFARTARLWVDGVPGTQAAKVAEEVSGITPQGGTNLEEAMNLAYETALRHYLPAGVNRVVLLTDGAANLGDVDPDTLKKKVETHRQQGIALDCFGIGWEGYNDDLLEVLTRNADGRYGFINTPEEAATEFAAQLAGALRVAASDVKVQVEFNPARVTAYRQVGYAKHQLTKEQFRDNTVNAAQIGAAESGTALYVVEVNPAGEGALATVRVRYKVPGTTEYREMAWPVPYTGNALALEQSTPAMRLAGTASAFSEWLALSPFGADVTSDRLLRCLNGVPEIYGPDARPKRLEEMIRQTQRNPAISAPATRTRNTDNRGGG